MQKHIGLTSGRERGAPLAEMHYIVRVWVALIGLITGTEETPAASAASRPANQFFASKAYFTHQ